MFIPMESWEKIIKTLVEGMGFSNYNLELSEDGNRNTLFIYDDERLIQENRTLIFDAINHLLQMLAKKNGARPIFLDVNNYRQERERLITELARVAAKKVAATKQEIALDPMNSYERRIVHVELAIHPDVTTESMGDGKDRYIVIKPVKT
jgi:spoIIIJ-associated protein